MVKIINRKSLGIQPVYDIGVEKYHNFLLANGLVASNCFNKSHSTAYAYVTYQTAYLKANYPTEYMSALLTASSDSQDKVEKYRENCIRMSIEVEPPDINRSQSPFIPSGDHKILCGLSAVRNLGQGAVENILKAREEAGGKFESLADFCSRIDLRVVNRRALEPLIKCGAFDNLQSNRQQLINDLEPVISWAQSRAKDKETGQLSLFDLMGNNNSDKNKKNTGFEYIPRGKKTEDFSIQEKLKDEKELLGFYVSEHPLKAIHEQAWMLSPINLSEFSEQKSRTQVSVVVMLNYIKHHTTKKGDLMAFIKMEDFSGEVEGVVFPDTYARIKKLLVDDARLIVWGKVEKKDDKVQLIVDNAEVIEKVNIVILEILPQQAINESIQNNLKGILQEQSGDKNKAKVPVFAAIGTGKNRRFVRFGKQFWVQNEQAAVESLNHARFQAHYQPLIPPSS